MTPPREIVQWECPECGRDQGACYRVNHGPFVEVRYLRAEDVEALLASVIPQADHEAAIEGARTLVTRLQKEKQKWLDRACSVGASYLDLQKKLAAAEREHGEAQARLRELERVVREVHEKLLDSPIRHGSHSEDETKGEEFVAPCPHGRTHWSLCQHCIPVTPLEVMDDWVKEKKP